MAETRRRFDPEFRDGAMRIVRETGKSIAQVARDLGINDGTLANWVKKDREARGEAAAGQLSEDERAELARLRRENAELAMARRCRPAARFHSPPAWCQRLKRPVMDLSSLHAVISHPLSPSRLEALV